jgi:hypothetical protein
MTDQPKNFPVLWTYRREEQLIWTRLGCPKTVPWSLLAPHEAQARKNHDQSLARLAERGGLDPTEMVALFSAR